MATATQTNTARIVNIFGRDAADWQVHELDGHLLVDDTATRYFLAVDDLGEDSVTDAPEQFEADRSAPDDISGDHYDDDDAHDDAYDRAEARRCNAYSILCQTMVGIGDGDVPAEVLAEAREVLGLGADEPVCHGW